MATGRSSRSGDSYIIPTPELVVRENPITDVLYGPDGEVLAIFTERPVVKFGFHPGRWDKDPDG